MRPILVLLLCLIALPAAAYEWEYLGMDGIAATTLTVDAARERLFVGTYEGFWLYDQAADAWLERDEEGWIGRQVFAIDYHESLSDRVITGRENGFFKGYLEISDDLGETWTHYLESTGGRVKDVFHDDSARHFACTASDIAPGEFFRSENGGETWTPLGGHGFYSMTDIDIDLGGQGLVLTGNAGVRASGDYGDTWQNLTGDLAGSWVHCAQGVYAGGDVIPPVSLVVGLDAGLYFSEVPGQWTQLLDAPIRRAERIPVPAWLAPDRMAVCTWDARVLVSQGFGAGWLDETGDLPGEPIDVAFSPFDNGLYVLTNEGGLWRHAHVVTAAPAAPAAATVLRAHPNPFNPRTTLRFTLPAAGRARLSVFDVSGRELATLFDAARPAGEQSVDWNAEGLPSGVYLAKLSQGARESATRLVLLR